MPRKIKLRKVVAPPAFKGFRPYGTLRSDQQPVELLYEEYEAIKLADYEGLKHLEACKLMGISRPTFARIYDQARKKIALALAEAREIRTVYGNAVMDESWHLCLDCNARFTLPAGSNSSSCPVCRSQKTTSVKNT
jgi:predicted DNA-binding protein (UPF0251 family)